MDEEKGSAIRNVEFKRQWFNSSSGLIRLIEKRREVLKSRDSAGSRSFRKTLTGLLKMIKEIETNSTFLPADKNPDPFARWVKENLGTEISPSSPAALSAYFRKYSAQLQIETYKVYESFSGPKKLEDAALLLCIPGIGAGSVRILENFLKEEHLLEEEKKS